MEPQDEKNKRARMTRPDYEDAMSLAISSSNENVRAALETGSLASFGGKAKD